MSDEELLSKAKEAMKNAYCPYSNFPVGAAVLTDDDTIVVGANHENASYGGTICAERSAMTSALTRGYRKFKAIAIVTELERPAAPCGLCRQFLVEFGNYKLYTHISQNSSDAFTPIDLDDHAEQKKLNP
uniref:Cytidine deaminase n=1 Tax=Heterorhabditis bacteriophora TaxID=37862 RepID=A0A1I7WM29_HETBA